MSTYTYRIFSEANDAFCELLDSIEPHELADGVVLRRGDAPKNFDHVPGIVYHLAFHTYLASDLGAPSDDRSTVMLLDCSYEVEGLTDALNEEEFREFAAYFKRSLK